MRFAPNDLDRELLHVTADAIVSGCTASHLRRLYPPHTDAGKALRRYINTNIGGNHKFKNYTLLMLLPFREKDDEDTLDVAKFLQSYGAGVDATDSVNFQSPLKVAAELGFTRLLQWLIDEGADIASRNLQKSPTYPVNVAVQNNEIHSVAVLCRAAVLQNQMETMNDVNLYNKSCANVALGRAFVESIGILAKAGADLRRGFALYWTPLHECMNPQTYSVDPDPDMQPHSSLMQTMVSFNTMECVECKIISESNVCCARCRMAHYCGKECQTKNYKTHKLVCKRLRKGQDLLDDLPLENGKLPRPNPEQFGFTRPFLGDDFEGMYGCGSDDDDDDDYGDGRPVWEYNAGKRGKPEWKKYPPRIQDSLESLLESTRYGNSRYMYRPGGGVDCEGVSYQDVEQTPTERLPPTVSTNYVYYTDMLEREIDTGAVRAVRRNGSRQRPALRDLPPGLAEIVKRKFDSCK